MILYEICGHIGTLASPHAYFLPEKRGMCNNIATAFYKIITNKLTGSGYYIARCEEHPVNIRFSRF